MGYTTNLDTVITRLTNLGLLPLAHRLRDGKVNKITPIEVTDPRNLDKVKHLIYSWFKHNHISGAYKIKWHSSTSFLIEPTPNKDNIIGRSKG